MVCNHGYARKGEKVAALSNRGAKKPQAALIGGQKVYGEKGKNGEESMQRLTKAPEEATTRHGLNAER